MNEKNIEELYKQRRIGYETFWKKLCQNLFEAKQNDNGIFEI